MTSSSCSYRKFLKFFVLIVYLLFPILTMGQTRIIFFDDTTKLMGMFENGLDQPYYIVPFYDLKEKLPDGNYTYVDANRKDSAKVDLEEITLIKGQYLDSLRTGRFEYYYFCTNKRKEVRVLTSIYNYNKGLLDGYYMSRKCVHMSYQGHYRNGKRHGYFFTYGADGELIELELYQNDALLFHSKYPNITIAQPSAK